MASELDQFSSGQASSWQYRVFFHAQDSSVCIVQVLPISMDHHLLVSTWVLQSYGVAWCYVSTHGPKIDLTNVYWPDKYVPTPFQIVSRVLSFLCTLFFKPRYRLSKYMVKAMHKNRTFNFDPIWQKSLQFNQLSSLVNTPRILNSDFLENKI